MENWYMLIGRDYRRVMLLLVSVLYAITTESLMLIKTSLKCFRNGIYLLHNYSWTTKQSTRKSAVAPSW